MAVTPSPEAMKVLEELAAAMGQPKSALVAELLDEALPALKTTLDALRVVQERPQEAQRLLMRYAAEKTMELSQQQLSLDEAIDGRTVKGKRARRRADGASR